MPRVSGRSNIRVNLALRVHNLRASTGRVCPRLAPLQAGAQGEAAQQLMLQEWPLGRVVSARDGRVRGCWAPPCAGTIVLEVPANPLPLLRLFPVC